MALGSSAGTLAFCPVIRRTFSRSVKVTVRDVHQTDVKRAFARPAVALTALGQLRIGTVLVDGCSTAEVALPSKTLRVVFSSDCTTPDLRPLYRQLRQRPDWFVRVALGGCALRLPLRGGGDLWIPGLEYFSRCYGRSQEVKRILLECPWDQAEERFDVAYPVRLGRVALGACRRGLPGVRPALRVRGGPREAALPGSRHPPACDRGRGGVASASRDRSRRRSVVPRSREAEGSWPASCRRRFSRPARGRVECSCLSRGPGHRASGGQRRSVG